MKAQPKVNLDIYWCRHSYSCANFLKSIGLAGVKDALKHLRINDARGKYARNSGLTNVINYQKLDHPIPKLNLDLIVTSELLRSIQTAYHLKPETEIRPIPFIGELRAFLKLDLDNAPSSMRKMKALHKDHAYFQKVNYDLYTKILTRLKKKEKKKAHDPNLKLFFEYCFPEMLTHLTTKFPKKSSFKILIVSHQKFIDKLIKTSWHKTPNLGVYKQSLEISGGGIILNKSPFEMIYPGKWDTPIPITIDSTKIEINPNLKAYKQIKSLSPEIISQIIAPCQYNFQNYTKKKSQIRLKTSKKSLKSHGKHNRTKRKTSRYD